MSIFKPDTRFVTIEENGRIVQFDLINEFREMKQNGENTDIILKSGEVIPLEGKYFKYVDSANIAHLAKRIKKEVKNTEWSWNRFFISFIFIASIGGIILAMTDNINTMMIGIIFLITILFAYKIGNKVIEGTHLEDDFIIVG